MNPDVRLFVLVGRLISCFSFGWATVCGNFMQRRIGVTLPCSYQSTCFLQGQETKKICFFFYREHWQEYVVLKSLIMGGLYKVKLYHTYLHCRIKICKCILNKCLQCWQKFKTCEPIDLKHTTGWRHILRQSLLVSQLFIGWVRERLLIEVLRI